MLAIAHEAMMPPSSHVFTMDSAPWTQDVCGPDSLQIVEENFGYDLKIKTPCDSINVSKYFKEIARLSGANDYVPNPSFYNIADGKLIQDQDGDWYLTRFDAAESIEIGYSGSPDRYEILLPTINSSRIVNLTSEQIRSAFESSISSTLNSYLPTTPLPLSVATEAVIENSRPHLDSPQVDSAKSQEPSNKEVNNQSEYDFLHFIKGLWIPDEVTNMNLLEKLGSVFGLLLMIEIGKLMIVSGERFLNESDQVVGNKNKINSVSTVSTEYNIPEARKLSKGQSRRPAASITPKSMSSETTSSDPELSDEFIAHLAKCGIVLPTPEEKQRNIDLLNSLRQIDDQNDSSEAKPPSRESLDTKKSTKPAVPRVLSEEEEGRLKNSGINDILARLLGGDDEAKK